MDRFKHVPSKRHKFWFEDALSSLSQAKSTQAIGDTFYALASAEGFRNLVMVRLRDGQIVDLAWARLPQGFAEHYIANDWTKVDPVHKWAKSARTAFSWQEVLDRQDLSEAERSMMAEAAVLGVHSGYTIPFHGPDNTSAHISFSMREPHLKADKDRIPQLNVLALFSLSRLAEFDDLPRERGLAALEALGSSPSGAISPLDGSANGRFTLTHAHLRELVLIEVGVRRWQMGLTELGTRIFKNKAKSEIVELERWGLVVEAPDDDRWCFHLAPSVLGWSYLRTRAEVEWMRRHIWEHEVDRNEMPDTAGIS